MRSTGEVLGLADSFGMAFYKSQMAAGYTLPTEGAVLVTVANSDKEIVLPAVQRLAAMGFTIFATAGTGEYLQQHGVECTIVKKLHEGRPHLVDAMQNHEISLVINTPSGKDSIYDDSYIRKSAIKFKISYITTPAAAVAAAEGIACALGHAIDVKSLQAYHRDVKVGERDSAAPA